MSGGVLGVGVPDHNLAIIGTWGTDKVNTCQQKGVKVAHN